MPEYHRKKQYSGIKNLGTRMSRGNGRGIRTWTQAFRTLLLALLVITILRILIFFYRRKKQTPVRMSVFSWQRYKDSNLKWRSQRLAIFFQNRLFKPFFRLCVSQKSLGILFLLSTANSYEKLWTLHWGVERSSKSALSFTSGYCAIWWRRI